MRIAIRPSARSMMLGHAVTAVAVRAACAMRGGSGHIIAGAAAIALTWWIAAKIFNRRLAAWPALVVALLPPALFDSIDWRVVLILGIVAIAMSDAPHAQNLYAQIAMLAAAFALISPIVAIPLGAVVAMPLLLQLRDRIHFVPAALIAVILLVRYL